DQSSTGDHTVRKASEPLQNAKLVWYKNSQPLPKINSTINNTLYLDPVSSEDAGSYSCGVDGYEDDLSPAVTLSVRYAPKAPFVSVSPSGRIVEGGSLTLICNSEAHPPVYYHSWFKKTATGSVQIGSDKNHKFSDIMLEDSGRYYCVAKNELGEESSSMMYIEVTAEYEFSVMEEVDIEYEIKKFVFFSEKKFNDK
ncbi:B-cell receptor CD22-like, partial [Clupea harengus]|uniref:B-cell receptor CD22-like n=1 Tax=Clupea harengus TaxID=7950 RepID=A0A8M1KDJ1_CLUHA